VREQNGEDALVEVQVPQAVLSLAVHSGPLGVTLETAPYAIATRSVMLLLLPVQSSGREAAHRCRAARPFVVGAPQDGPSLPTFRRGWGRGTQTPLRGRRPHRCRRPPCDRCTAWSKRERGWAARTWAVHPRLRYKAGAVQRHPCGHGPRGWTPSSASLIVRLEPRARSGGRADAQSRPRRRRPPRDPSPARRSRAPGRGRT
jgi:hypothetical protein